MKPLLNTLYVTTEGAYLGRERETVVVRIKDKPDFRLPIHMLSGIVCVGRVLVTPQLMGLCAERNVTISFLTEHGRFIARVTGPVPGNVLLRRTQYRWADDPVRTADIARNIVIAKILNSRVVLSRTIRDHRNRVDIEAIERVIHRFDQILNELLPCQDVDKIRGFEGEAARLYFGVFDWMIVAQKEDFYFRERSRRPPMDPMNALLSFLYTLLLHDVVSALETVGLDPAVGFLHKDRPGRPSLGLDLMEEFRACLADRLALTLVNRKQIQVKEFERSEVGAILMTDDARKTVIEAYQTRKRDEIEHPYLRERIPIGLLMHVQAMLMARYLRGDIDEYPPCIMR